ncbi:WXG100 family type VII secretion target [Nonomuraea longicatena]|uniref:WXG100 family type VII secretion target n=1 Tax=Nonomuraea longicatena TaxID=83682 RepID=A0ABP3ZJ47_9ACTN
MSEKAVKKDHELRPNQCMDLSVDPDGRNVAQVKQLIQMLDPKRIEKAGNAYVDAGAAMAQLEDDLLEMANAMAACWEGKASVEAQKALQVIHASVRELQRRLFHMGRPLENLGQNVLPRHKQFIDNDGYFSWSNNSATWDDSIAGTYDVMDGGAEWGSQDELAGKHLAILNKDFAETYHLLPTTIHKELPELKDPEIPKFDGVGGPGGVGGPSGGLPGGVPGGIPSAGVSPRGASPGDFDSGLPPVDVPPGATPPGNLPSGVPDRGAVVPGTPAPGQPGIPDPSSVPPAPAAPATPAVGTVPDPSRSTSLADAAPRFDVPAAPTAPTTPGPATPPSVPSAQYPLRIGPYENGNPYGHPGMPSGVSTGVGTGGGYGGSGAANNAALRGATGGAAVGGAPFMPMGGMGGGGGGGDEQDREASTWLKEDDDVWGLQSDGTVTDTIG